VTAPKSVLVIFDNLTFPLSAPEKFENCNLLTADQQLIVTEWLPSASNSAKWKLAWRGSRDGFSAKTFHSLCDLKGENVVVIKSKEGYLFGGYCATSWNANKHGQEEEAPSSFIFTLTNPHGIPPTKYSRKMGENAIFHTSRSGPAFRDISVEDNSNANDKSYTCFPHYYLDTTGKGSKTFNGAGSRSASNGSVHFVVSDVEVFTH
jgi:hypothetical protein